MQELMDTKNDQFAWVDWMVAEREKQGLTQADLSRITGLTRTTISDYEKRIRPNPSIDALMKISEGLGYPAEHLPRIAKIIPAVAEGLSDEIAQIVHEAEKLNLDDQREVVAYIRMLNNLRKKKK
jgi:transcriptional regulator with XRE-family HTH domain